MTQIIDRASCEALDAKDPLASCRDSFQLPNDMIYLDGNSLGALPKNTIERLQNTVAQEWGNGLISSWNNADWVNLPKRVGNKIATLIGANEGEVTAADSTSVNLFKVLAAALNLRPDRRVILSEKGNFPTDLYMAQGLSKLLGGQHELRLVERDQLVDAIDDSVAVVMLTQVDYRFGTKLDMAKITALAQDNGALTIWDLCHSAAAFPVDLNTCNADFAVGCGYKYLNGGPGSPAFLFVAKRHQEQFEQPLSGWHGHDSPFSFDTDYRPAKGIERYLCGTQPVLGLVGLDSGVDSVLAAQDKGGLRAMADKSNTLVDVFIGNVLDQCAQYGVTCISPTKTTERGCQASFTMADGNQAYAVVQALISRGVIGDFRAPNILRFGFASLYIRHVDAFDAAAHFADVLNTEQWNHPSFLTKQAVT